MVEVFGFIGGFTRFVMFFATRLAAFFTRQSVKYSLISGVFGEDFVKNVIGVQNYLHYLFMFSIKSWKCCRTKKEQIKVNKMESCAGFIR